MPSLARYLNKTILVSIPALFEDGLCRPFTLISVEPLGLWLQSGELTERLLHAKRENRQLTEMGPVVFVPFGQIAGVLVTTSAPPNAEYRLAPREREAHERETQRSSESNTRKKSKKSSR
jgi:Zn-finger nucleic acid-binding protein